MKKRYLGVIALIVVSIIAVGGYYLYYSGGEDKYYDNYKFQSNAMDNATELSGKALATIFGSLMGNKTSGVTGELDHAKNNVSAALAYDQEMVKYAKTDSQKKYAEILISEANAMSRAVDLIRELTIALENKNEARVTELNNKLDQIGKEMDGYQKNLESIEANDTVLKNRLEKEYEKIDKNN